MLTQTPLTVDHNVEMLAQPIPADGDTPKPHCGLRERALNPASPSADISASSGLFSCRDAVKRHHWAKSYLQPATIDIECPSKVQISNRAPAVALSTLNVGTCCAQGNGWSSKCWNMLDVCSATNCWRNMFNLFVDP